MDGLLALDIMDEDVQAFRERGEPCIIEGSSLDPKIVIVANEEQAKWVRFRGVVCYLPEEIPILLSFKDAENVHAMKRKMGGTLREGGFDSGQIKA